MKIPPDVDPSTIVTEDCELVTDIRVGLGYSGEEELPSCILVNINGTAYCFGLDAFMYLGRMGKKAMQDCYDLHASVHPPVKPYSH